MGEDLAISLKNVSKCYKRYARPVERLKEILLPEKCKADLFWALQDIDLEIFKGQTVGLVGQNGSGKSTLLQIVVGTLAPTTGQVRVNGRISALLELGSGFNPEFTGRQNVFFNGQILGLKQQEIEAKFDEIAFFADIGDFIDQPVKTYSSGMLVRLAFAVAINAEPDILIVDEALAVGDEAFQRKCFSRIKSLQERGATILFVSHTAASILELCNSAVLIHQGKLLIKSKPKLVLSQYHKLLYAPVDRIETVRQEICSIARQAHPTVLIKETKPKKPEKETETSTAFYDPNLKPQSTITYISRGATVENPCIETPEGKVVNVLVKGEEYVYKYSVKFTEAAYKVRFAMLIKTVSGFELGGGTSHTLKKAVDYIPSSTLVQVKFKFGCLLLPGTYFLNNGVLGRIDEEEVFLYRCIDAVMFRVQPEEDLIGTSIIDFKIEPDISIIKQPLTL